MLYNNDMRDGELLKYEVIAPNSPYHAAFVSIEGHRRDSVKLHRHDFFEFMFIVDGQGIHQINGRCEVIAAGEVILIRNSDSHLITVAPGETVSFINIAFPTDRWSDFIDCAGLRREHDKWMGSNDVPTAPAPDGARDAFHKALVSAQAEPEIFSLFKFWSDVVPLFVTRRDREKGAQEEPEWLTRACLAMESQSAEEGGLTRFVSEAGVSNAHLSRTLKRCRGLTPMELLNQLKLKRAAGQLTTTNEGILEIALDSGFDNLSYFYRRFRKQYGVTPLEYRRQAWRRIAP
jgi:AraC family cel operon transcriptional repressor